ncbi:P-loop containing nucleoside triphosphate hydrolase protein [Clavulina sp. PMI_390]|nr:P-loop containing nucleoside triphosphate hydrolase protein [Clavulina sp. PMI_390]
MSNDALPWVEKYRPNALTELVSHGSVTATIQRFIDQNRIPHLLFYGPPGTGKTSLVLAMARQLFGSDYKKQILELNASDDRGIDVVREQIRDFADSGKLFKNTMIKIIVLDEADMMTQTAQAALRRVIEQYTKNVRFCIICNYVNKIIPAIQSRCTRFRLGPLPVEEIRKRLDFIVENESVEVTPDGLDALLTLSKGDMRRALNVLQACHAGYPVVDRTAVYNCTGTPHPDDIEVIIHAMMSDDFTTCYRRITSIKIDKGLALQDLLTATHQYIDRLDLPKQSRVYLLTELANIEYRISCGATEKIQLSGLIGAFKHGIDIGASSV